MSGKSSGFDSPPVVLGKASVLCAVACPCTQSGLETRAHTPSAPRPGRNAVTEDRGSCQHVSPLAQCFQESLEILFCEIAQF